MRQWEGKGVEMWLGAWKTQSCGMLVWGGERHPKRTINQKPGAAVGFCALSLSFSEKSHVFTGSFHQRVPEVKSASETCSDVSLTPASCVTHRPSQHVVRGQVGRLEGRRTPGKRGIVAPRKQLCPFCAQGSVLRTFPRLSLFTFVVQVLCYR